MGTSKPTVRSRWPRERMGGSPERVRLHPHALHARLCHRLAHALPKSIHVSPLLSFPFPPPPGRPVPNIHITWTQLAQPSPVDTLNRKNPRSRSSPTTAHSRVAHQSTYGSIRWGKRRKSLGSWLISRTAQRPGWSRQALRTFMRRLLSSRWARGRRIRMWKRLGSMRCWARWRGWKDSLWRCLRGFWGMFWFLES